MADEPDITLDNHTFSMHIPRKAPRFLDDKGMRFKDDPLKAAWEQMQEAFSRLHGQRILEVMEQALMEVPTDEALHMEWEHEEKSYFYLRFSNGWSMNSWTDQGGINKPNTDRLEHSDGAIAPPWFPRDKAGFARWKQCHAVLSGSTIDAHVDNMAQERLYALCDALGGLSRKHLDKIKLALVGEEWGSSLESIALHTSTPDTPKKNTSKPRRM